MLAGWICPSAMGSTERIWRSRMRSRMSWAGTMPVACRGASVRAASSGNRASAGSDMPLTTSLRWVRDGWTILDRTRLSDNRTKRMGPAQVPRPKLQGGIASSNHRATRRHGEPSPSSAWLARPLGSDQCVSQQISNFFFNYNYLTLTQFNFAPQGYPHLQRPEKGVVSRPSPIRPQDSQAARRHGSKRTCKRRHSV